MGESPSHILLNHACCLQTVCDHLPLALGLVSSDKESATYILSRKGGGNLLSIVVGGTQETLNARPGAFKLVLRNRKGFIRLALMHGYWGEGSGFNWRFPSNVVWREGCRCKYRSYFSRQSLQSLTMKIVCW